MPLVVFFALMAVLTGFDIYQRRLPNLIVLPAIVLGIVMKQQGIPVVLCFLIGLWIYKKNYWAGGDIKLFIMATAFLGWFGLGIVPLTALFLMGFRKLRNYHYPLPVAPFMTVASVVIVIAERLIRQFCL